jgi:Tol biopolymer transport system component
MTTRTNVVGDAGFTNDFSFRPAVSADGRCVAFNSLASNLTAGDAGDANKTFDIFVLDRVTRAMVPASVSGSGQLGNGPSFGSALNADCRIMAYASDATNLQAGSDTNGSTDIFVHEFVTNTTTRISVGVGGAEANGASFAPSISGDARWVAFHSNATNLVSGADGNNAADVFVFDRMTNTTTRVTLGDNDSFDPVVSADGSVVAFGSAATNLVSGDTNAATDVFVWTRSNQQIARVSLSSSGAQAHGRSAAPSMSSDARFVAFESDAADLVANDTNNATDIFVRDRTNGQTTRVSVTSAAAQVANSSLAPTISADGNFVAFSSDATTLVTGDTNGKRDIFIRDRAASKTTLASISTTNGSADDGSESAWVSGQGLAIVFESVASNLVQGGTCKTRDIFVRDLLAPATTWNTGVAYAIGDLVTFTLDGGVVTYECIQAHTSTSASSPPAATSLWRRPVPCGLAPWAPQSRYYVGSLVTFQNKKYRSLSLHTSVAGQDPAIVPAIWQVVP